VDSQLYANGDRIDVNVTATNHDTFDLDNWSVFAMLESDSDEYEEVDFNTVPITLAAGESNSFIVSVTIPEDNPFTKFELWAGVMKSDYVVSSSAGSLTAWAFQDWWDDNRIQISPDCEGANIDGINPVNFADFLRLAAQWRKTGIGLEGDIDGNESVDYGDVAILAKYWLRNCPDSIASTTFRGDLNGDQKLDIQELLILTDDWLSGDIFPSRRHRKLKLSSLRSR